MARLFYGNVELQIVHTNIVDRQFVMSSDDSTYLYTKWTVDVQAVWNPQATSYGPPSTNPTQMPGILSAKTDRNLRHYLSQPRRLLVLQSAGLTFLSSPPLGLNQDCRNGPIPEVLDIVKMPGDKTWTIHFRVTTFVNECPNLGVLLSHRWTKHCTYNEDYFATLVTDGECVFRSDGLEQQAFALKGGAPDNYRLQLFAPVPPNFQRRAIDVVPASDGVTYTYRTVDVELPFNIGTNSPATRIEAYQTGCYSQMSDLHAAAATGVQLQDVATLGISFGARFFQNAMPKYRDHVLVRVWGNRNSFRADLTSLALNIVQTRLGNSWFKSDEWIVTHDLNGKFTEVQCTQTSGIEQAAVAAASGALGVFAGFAPGMSGIGPQPGLSQVLSKFPRDETIGTVLGPGFAGNPGPPNNGRGTYLGLVVAQSLSTPCTLPPAPPAYQRASEYALL